MRASMQAGRREAPRLKPYHTTPGLCVDPPPFAIVYCISLLVMLH